MMAAFLMVCMFILIPTDARAAGNRDIKTLTNLSLQKKKKTGWVNQNGNYYFYRKGVQKFGWVKHNDKKYYTDPITGIRLTGFQTIDEKTYYFNKKYGFMLKNGMWKIEGKRYYFRKYGQVYKNGMLTIGENTYYFGEDGAAVTGFLILDDYTYYFRKKAYMATGWLNIGSKKYHFNETDTSRPIGAMDTGLVLIDGEYYFFDNEGVQIRDDFAYDGKLYSFDGLGRCTISEIPVPGETEEPDNTVIDPNFSVSDDLIFFTVWESGRTDDFYAGYNQTGGDRGNACGKYQFDYRYSLLNLVRFCYKNDPVFFKEFEPYIDVNKAELQGNKEFYEAWNKIYEKNRVKFANYQDVFAKQEYYDTTEKKLLSYGIDISNRPDIVKGAVYSYSIQCGQITAANAVVLAKINNDTSDEDFIKKLYKQRIKAYPAYTNRYKEERIEALRRLSLLTIE